MDEIRRVKLKTGVQTAFAKLWKCGFNRTVKGVKAKYNLDYYGDGLKGHTLDIMYPKDRAGGLPCVIYTHGGGWCAYDKSLFRSTTKMLSSCGAVTFNCNLRLAPDYGFKEMEEDAAAAVEFAVQHAKEYGGDPNRIILAGDSSGAHILSLYLNRLTADGDKGAERVKGCVFFYGVYDLTALDGVNFNNRQAYTEAVMPMDMPERNAYLKANSPVSYLSPKLPPVLLCSGKIDPLYAGQTKVYAEKLKEIGVRVETLTFPEEDKKAAHRYITFSRNRAAKKSFAKFKEFINSLEK